MKRDRIAAAGRRLTGGLGLVALACGARASSGAPIEEPEIHVAWSALRNGGFEERGDAESPAQIPWWRSKSGLAQLEKGADGATVLRTGPGEHAQQPVAGYAPLVQHFRLAGKVRGAGVVLVTDGGGGVARFPVGQAGDATAEFAVTGADLERALGHAPVPRFVVRLEGAGDAIARWDDVAATVALPCPTEESLRREVIGQLDAIFTTWAERALDVDGPRKTTFVARGFDVVTGKQLVAATSAAPVFVLHESLLAAVAVHDEPRWRALLERHVEDVLTLALQPDTGLPCAWDPAADVRLETTPVEIALAFGYLIDVAREGPEAFRARARAAAVKIGEAVLARGVLPDGEVAASYVPRTGAPNVNVSRLRRLDVPCQLARLTELTGDARFVAPAREALRVLEFTNHWAGTWDTIDPAFDDDYGHYGARAATIARALPHEAAFERFAREGFRHFAPLWRDAMRFGGNLAADQVRTWRIASDVARTEPELAAQLGPLVADAVFAHVQGEQYGNGAWGDVTIFRSNPKTGLQVGDMPGTPQNLLNGLAAAYTGDLGLRTDLTRALFTAVLRSTVTEYGRPHGFLLGRVENERGGNHAHGSLRPLLGLTTMLRGLSPPR